MDGGAISWNSVKQSCIANSTLKVEYVVACEVIKETIWLEKFIYDIGVMRLDQVPITLFCNNSGVVIQSKEPRNHKRGKNIERKYHLIRDIVVHEDVMVAKIASANNMTYPFTVTLP